MESEFKKSVYSYRLNILIDMMNSIDSTKILELATNERINRNRIVEAIDNAFKLYDKSNSRDQLTFINLKKLKNIMLEGINSYQQSFID